MTEKIRRWTIGSEKEQLFRILGIAFLIFLLQIPIYQIGDLIHERRTTRDLAVAEVTQKWGKRQVLQGPLIIVPYLKQVQQKQGSPWIVEQKKHYATFLPEHLNAKVNIDSEMRYRSIYGIPLYHAQVKLKGDFDLDRMVLEAKDRDLQWDKAQFVITMSDPKSVQKESSLNINARDTVLEPGAGDGMPGASGFHTPLNLGESSGKSTFELTLEPLTPFFLAMEMLGEEAVQKLESLDPTYFVG